MNLSGDLETVLKCPICSNSYDGDNNIPLIIPCQEKHTICSQCLSSILSKPGKFHCPLDGTTPIHNKEKNNIEFELNKTFIEALDDSCSYHPNRKLDLICRQCRCKICLACEKKGLHQGHETVLLEEYEKKYISKLEETQRSFVKLNDIQSSKEAILCSKEKELQLYLENLINQYIEKIRIKETNIKQEITRFFTEIKEDQIMGLPFGNSQTSQFLNWKVEMGNKLSKLRETSIFSEFTFNFVDEEKILISSDLDNWLKESRKSLQKLEGDLEEVSMRLKVELDAIVEGVDALDLKIKLFEKDKRELQSVEIVTPGIIFFFFR